MNGDKGRSMGVLPLLPSGVPASFAATIGDHFIHVHVELSAAAGHPDVQRKHVVMLTVQDFVANLYNQLVRLIIEPFAGINYVSCTL
jgi:hypothetical protein